MALNISRVSADEIPSTKHTGRKRTPSIFDDYMYDMSDNEWVRIETPDEDSLKEFERELSKALKYANKGADKRYAEGVAYFHVRPRIAKPRQAKEVEPGGVEIGQDNVEQLPVDEPETGKRTRKTALAS